MKMAKASERDMEMAKSLCTALESLERGLMPVCAQAAEDEDPEDFDSADDEQCGRALRHVLAVLRDGSIGRVVWGMEVLLDPANKVVDPSADTLEDHPDVAQAKADRERCRAWIEEAVNYVGCATWSPSLKEEGDALLRALGPNVEVQRRP